MLLAVLALGWTLVSPAAGERSDERFIADLQDASVQNNRAAIAAMVHYPIKVLASGWIIPVNDRATFIRYFDAFFTDDMKDLIADAASKPRSGAPADVVSIGNGVIRAMAFNGRVRVPSAGDYVVDIVRVAPAGDAVLTYTLSISVR